jgi:hypothetical protein
MHVRGLRLANVVIATELRMSRRAERGGQGPYRWTIFILTWFGYDNVLSRVHASSLGSIGDAFSVLSRIGRGVVWSHVSASAPNSFGAT